MCSIKVYLNLDEQTFVDITWCMWRGCYACPYQIQLHILRYLSFTLKIEYGGQSTILIYNKAYGFS